MTHLLTELFIANSNADVAISAKKYMRNKFEFLGITHPIRMKIIKAWLNDLSDLSNSEILNLILELYNLREREYHYTAIDIVTKYYQRFSYDEMKVCFELIDKESWWDTVDRWQKPFSLWIRSHKDLQIEIMNDWLSCDSFWKRRSAIILQLHWKTDLNTDLLKNAILRNKDDKEFFIKKAIGWALRDYSKTNPEWVRKFLQEHDLSTLSVREASKYL